MRTNVNTFPSARPSSPGSASLHHSQLHYGPLPQRRRAIGAAVGPSQLSSAHSFLLSFSPGPAWVLPAGCSLSRTALAWVHCNELPFGVRLAVHPVPNGCLHLGQVASHFGGASHLLYLLLNLALPLGQCTPH